MAWIAFASVPTILVVMLAMGQLEARLLPRTPDPNGDLDPIRVDVSPRAPAGSAGPAGAAPGWEIVLGPIGEGQEEART